MVRRYRGSPPSVVPSTTRHPVGPLIKFRDRPLAAWTRLPTHLEVVATRYDHTHSSPWRKFNLSGTSATSPGAT
jgi:hypothetical protein